SESRTGAPAGSALSTGSTTTRSSAAARRPRRSRVRIAPLRREEPRGPPLDEQDDEDEDQHLAEDGAEGGLDDLVESSDPDRRQDAAQQLADAPGDDDHERVDDVVLAQLGPHVADLGERAPREPGQPGAERERTRIHPARADAETRRHAAILGDRADS